MMFSENGPLDSNFIWDKDFASLHLSLDSFNDHSIFYYIIPESMFFSPLNLVLPY